MPALRLTVASHIDHKQATEYNINMPSDWISIFRVGLILVGILLFAALDGCGTNVEYSKNQPPAEVHPSAIVPTSSTGPDESITTFIRNLPFIEKKQRLGLLRAWTGVPNNARYRLARHSEFETPLLTHDYGEMAGAYGLAALIVDKTLTDARFSLVIFIERPADRYDVYWIYRNMDLAKYSMSRSSGDIFVSQIREDGIQATCEIQWDRKERRWACTAL